MNSASSFRVVLNGSLRSVRRLVPPYRNLSSAKFNPLTSRSLQARAVPRSHRTSVDQRLRSFSTAQPQEETTIYALSTAPGRAAIAIIRVSGSACLDIYRGLCPGKADPAPRHATIRSLHEPHRPRHLETTLDPGALVLYFPAPRTVTGEDVLELHVHGGPAVVKAVLAAIPRTVSGNVRVGGQIRYAEPGEFTRRAFLNGRIDLTQVEALGDTLSATTEQQRRLSVRGTTSGLAKRYEAWRQQLLRARGELEALIDFSEDQDFDESPAELCASVVAQVRLLVRTLQTHCQNAVRGEMLRSGISISLLGAPNAGKSSLLNCVVGREAAIVSPEAGTTRDIVEVGIDLGGYLCRLGDTAGLRRTVQQATQAGEASGIVGRVEKEGMRRARERAADSDVVILVLSFETVAGQASLYLEPEVIATAAELVATKDNVTVVVNKSDLSPTPSSLERAVQAIQEQLPGLDRSRIHFVSCKQAITREPNPPWGSQSPTSTPHQASDTFTDDPGQIQLFLRGLVAHFNALTSAIVSLDAPALDAADMSIWQESLGATARQRLLLEQCLDHLGLFLSEIIVGLNSSGEQENVFSTDAVTEPDIVLAAEHLRNAAACLARITGRGDAGDVEEVLGVVFEQFCVGK